MTGRCFSLTPPFRGVGEALVIGFNRFNGLSAMFLKTLPLTPETAEAVGVVSGRRITLLKQGVNETGAGSSHDLVENAG
jgi:hypothetical protein